MVAKSKHRGHTIYFDKDVDEWRYEDDGSLVKHNWKNRSCGECGEYATSEGHDPCLGTLPGVLNACCGHGESNDSYIHFENGVCIRGFDRIDPNRSLPGD